MQTFFHSAAFKNKLEDKVRLSRKTLSELKTFRELGSSRIFISLLIKLTFVLKVTSFQKKKKRVDRSDKTLGRWGEFLVLMCKSLQYRF